MRLIIYDNVRYLLASSTEEAIGEFHKQLPSIKADIAAMRATQPLWQKSFHRRGDWDIKEHFGITTVVYHSKLDKKKKITKLEESREVFTEHPVPVYELVSGVYWAPVLNRFWVGVSEYWDDPTLSQEVDPPTTDRHSVEFEVVTYGERTVFPLTRIGEPYWAAFPDDDERFNWSDEDLIFSSSSPDTLWLPGGIYGIGSDYANWPWLSDAWYGTISPVDFQEWGTDAIIKPCDEAGEILRSNNLAHLEELLDDGSPGPYLVYTGDAFPNHFYQRSDYLYRWETTYGYIITEMGYYAFGQCPFVVSEETVTTGTEIHEVLTQYGYKTRQVDDSNTISLNGESIVSGAYNTAEVFYFIWIPERITGAVNYSYSNNTPILLIDAVVYNAEDWEDYSAWCVMYYVEEQSLVNTFDIINSTDGNWYSDYGDALNDLDYPGIFKVVVKIADCPDEFILFEQEFTDMGAFLAESEQCEIYDFHGKPVYVMSVRIYDYVGDRGIFIYAMIYDNILHISEEFDTDSLYDSLAVVYESLGRWGLKSSHWCRAVGVKIVTKTTEEVVIEE